MAKRNIVVIGASAGGSEVIRYICSKIPSDYTGSILIVWHISKQALGYLPDMISRVCPLPVSNGVDGEDIMPGHIYVAPPDFHLTVKGHKLRVAHGPKENRFRPAIDPLFRSAALYYGPRVIGIILSGMLDDGTAGLWAIKDNGGITIVQDPQEADFPSMPSNAINNVKVEHILSASEIPGMIVKLADELVPENINGKNERLQIELNMVTDPETGDEEINQIGNRSSFTCPECNGLLWLIKDGKINRFRCRTGHAFSIETLISSLNESIEDDLWKTIRGLEESADLVRFISENLEGEEALKKQEYLQSAEKIEFKIKKLRGLIINRYDGDHRITPHLKV